MAIDTTEAGPSGHLRTGSVGLGGALFQAITHMGPACGIAFSIGIAIPLAGIALPLAVALGAVACMLVAICVGQMAKAVPSAGGLYSYVSQGLGPRAGFLTGWMFAFFDALLTPALFLLFAAIADDVIASELGIDLGWATYLLLAAAIVFALSYRDVRLSLKAGIVLGAFEILVFLALAVWMIVSNLDDLSLEPFNPANSPEGTFSGTFKAMVFAIFAFIGFEAAAPLGEEARDPKRTIPLVAVLSVAIIGLFYVITSYGWVMGTGMNGFVESTGATSDPWRAMATAFWSSGWILVAFALLNSALAAANAFVNAASRVTFAMARVGVLPSALARTHPTHRTPHVAISAVVAGSVVIAIALGAKFDPLTGFAILGTAATICFMVLYITVAIASGAYYWRHRRAEFSPILHGVVPAAATVAFVFPIYYLYQPFPPYPVSWAAWSVPIWLALGVGVVAYLAAKRPQALSRSSQVFVPDDAVPARPESAALATR